MDGRIPQSKRLALAQQTVKYQLTLIGASFKPLFVCKCSYWDSSRVKYWRLTRSAILHVNGQVIILWHNLIFNRKQDILIAKVWLIQLCVGKQIQLADTRVTHLMSENTSPHFQETPGFDRLPTSQNTQPHFAALSRNCGYMLWPVITREGKKLGTK